MRSGFTLIEILITIAILAVVSVTGLIGLSKYKGGQNIDLSMEELTSVIRDVQKRSITEQDGKQWGIRFDNASSSYEIWSGSSYASGTVDKLYSLGRNVTFGNPSTSTLDTIFSAISGKLSEVRVISLVNPRKEGIVGDIILTERGTITNRLEHGLVGYWHFDEATSTKAYDSSGMSNTGTLTNGPTWQTSSGCKAGACLSFDGTDDYVSIPDSSANLSGDFSISLWVSPNDDANNPRWFSLIDGSNNFQGGHIGSTEKVYFRFAGSVIQTTTGISLGEWHHVVWTMSGSIRLIYIDGVAQSTGSGGISADAAYSAIGGGYPDYTSNGLIDEVRIYNRAFSATEILDLYNDLK